MYVLPKKSNKKSQKISEELIWAGEKSSLPGEKSCQDKIRSGSEFINKMSQQQPIQGQAGGFPQQQAFGQPGQAGPAPGGSLPLTQFRGKTDQTRLKD